MTHPLEQVVAHLVKTGWTDDEARNLIRALTCESPERLVELMPQWVEYCCTIRAQMELLSCVATGSIRVDHNGEEWAYALDVEPSA